jgi:hypothetical protein
MGMGWSTVTARCWREGHCRQAAAPNYLLIPTGCALAYSIRLAYYGSRV